MYDRIFNTSRQKWSRFKVSEEDFLDFTPTDSLANSKNATKDSLDQLIDDEVLQINQNTNNTNVLKKKELETILEQSENKDGMRDAFDQEYTNVASPPERTKKSHTFQRNSVLFEQARLKSMQEDEEINKKLDNI